MYQHNLQSINKEFWCYKNPVNPSCIYLFLTYSLRSFTKLRPSLQVHQISSNLSYQIFKKTLTKSKAREIIYRDFKKLNKQCFNNDLGTQLSSESIKSYGWFENIFLNTLNEHASIKKKMLTASHAPYVTKELRIAIMKNLYLENLYFKKWISQSIK